MPPRFENEKPRRALGYNGRRPGRGGSSRGRGGSNATGGSSAVSQQGGRGRGRASGGGRDNTRSVGGRSYRRDNEGGSRRREEGGSRFGRRNISAANNDNRSKNKNNNNGSGNSNQGPQRRGPVLDESTSKLLRSLQERIRMLESQRPPQPNGRGGAVRRFGRQVDRAVGDRVQRQVPQQRRPQPRRGEGNGQRRTRSPDDRRSRRGGRAERFDEGRRGGVRDRYDWDDANESRTKRRRRDSQGPQPQQGGRKNSNNTAPQQYPPLRVHVRN